MIDLLPSTRADYREGLYHCSVDVSRIKEAIVQSVYSWSIHADMPESPHSQEDIKRAIAHYSLVLQVFERAVSLLSCDGTFVHGITLLRLTDHGIDVSEFFDHAFEPPIEAGQGSIDYLTEQIRRLMVSSLFADIEGASDVGEIEDSSDAQVYDDFLLELDLDLQHAQKRDF